MTKNLVSVTEGNCLRMIHHHSASFSQVSRNFLLRVIPNSVRVDSSNMNPQEFWNFGLNLVALNYQTPGLMMDLQVNKLNIILQKIWAFPYFRRVNLLPMVVVVMC